MKEEIEELQGQAEEGAEGEEDGDEQEANDDSEPDPNDDSAMSDESVNFKLLTNTGRR